MGCDIHAVTEFRRPGSKEWDRGVVPQFDRSYALFTLMANVRGGYEDSPEPLFEQRGWPTDASTWSNYAKQDWDGDAHSHSWLSATEFEQAINAYAEHCEASRQSVTLLGILGALKAYEAAGCEARILFFFDN